MPLLQSIVRVPRGVAAVVSSALLLAGCGSSGANTAPTPATLPAPGDPTLPAPVDPATLVPPPMPRASAPRTWNFLDAQPARLPILVATTRRAVVADRAGQRYGGDDADSLQFAVATVNVPSYRVRQEGEIPRPPSTRDNPFRWKPDSTLDMYVTTVVPLAPQRWAGFAADDIARSASRSVLVFVHGYNTSFEDAAVRAAQIVADVGFDGTVILFSWPSSGSLTGYVRDQQAARNSGYHLARLLRDIIPALRPDRVHLMGHSMGSEALSRAMAVLGNDSLPLFDQVMLAAPDVDARLFRREVLPQLKKRAQRITLYASDDDDALRASRALNGVWRLGLGGDSLVVLPDLDTIDASRVRGDALQHTLFGNPSLLADLHALLDERQPPALRRLLEIKRDSLHFWRFRGTNR